MIEHIQNISSLTSLHWALAYTGLMVHILIKLAHVEGPLRSATNKKFIFTTLASFLMIPALLVICTDTAMKELLPINYVTAFLSGYQAQEMMMVIASFAKTRKH
jgi:hypothetical protein